MRAAKKVLSNTIFLYIKIVITMAISLLSVPLILKGLGASDYGTYNLVAGVISMLAFLNASMSISTQRFMSVAIGEKDIRKQNEIYNGGVLLHFIIGIVLVCFFEIASLFLFDGFLNLPPQKIGSAKIVYQFLVISTFFTVISVPYGAVMNAKEDMLAFSIIGIVEAVLKLLLALSLALFNSNSRLVMYGAGMAVLMVLVTIANYSYVHFKYREFVFRPKHYFNYTLFKRMFSFAGWNTFGSIAMIGRNQGIAIVMNLFYGTIVNAAYGIANQINGVLNYFSSTFQRAINPQLMQSEGMNNRERLIRISFISSKFSILVLSFFAVPLIIEMPYILKLWLGRPPLYTLPMCRLVLVLSIVYQFSMGLMSSIQAVGQIKKYFIIISLLIIMNVPISYILLSIGYPPYFCIISFILIEIISLIVRLVMANNLVGINIKAFIHNVVYPSLLCVVTASFFALLIHVCLNEGFVRLVCVCFLYYAFFLILSWNVCLDANQRNSVKLFVVKFVKR